MAHTLREAAHTAIQGGGVYSAEGSLVRSVHMSDPSTALEQQPEMPWNDNENTPEY